MSNYCRIVCQGREVNYACCCSEFICDYENAPDCNQCIIQGGSISPQTGKKFRGNRVLYLKNFICQAGGWNLSEDKLYELYKEDLSRDDIKDCMICINKKIDIINF